VTLLLFVQLLIAKYSLSVCNSFKNGHHLFDLSLDFSLNLIDFSLDLSDLVVSFLSERSSFFLGILDKRCDSLSLLLEHALLLDQLAFPCLGFHTLSLLFLYYEKVFFLLELLDQVNKIWEFIHKFEFVHIDNNFSFLLALVIRVAHLRNKHVHKDNHGNHCREKEQYPEKKLIKTRVEVIIREFSQTKHVLGQNAI